MDLRLYEAARLGNTDMLQALLEEDRLILERGSLAIVPETCLHIAALAGRVNFVREIMCVKPEFATKLNKDGFSPIHMASANGHAELVKEFLAVDEKLGRQKSADGRTALHFATLTGSVAVLRELTRSCPGCKVDLTEQQESALHLALKNNQVEAFELLFGIMKETNTEEMKVVVNVQDHDGNTVLHVATARRQFQAVKLLLDQRGDENFVKVEVNTTNRSGSSALDMLHDSTRNVSEAVDREIRGMLQEAGAVRFTSRDILDNSNRTVPASTTQIDDQPNHVPHNPAIWTYLIGPFGNIWLNEMPSLLTTCKLWTTLIQEIENSDKDTQNALMVVSILIATVTYQSILTPVGGFQQVTAGQNLKHSNGIAVVGSDVLMFFFIAFFSSTGFFLSVLIILMLTSQFPLKVLLRLAVLAMFADFWCTLLYIAPLHFNTVLGILILLFMAVVFHIIYFITWMLYKLWRSRRRRTTRMIE